jgi:xanthine/uracil/vitamin C permease (AzgA family)
MLPSALGVGEGGSFRSPMAIAVIGGIIVSTVLSLVVVPSFFLIMDDVSRFLGWLFGRFVGKKDDELLAMEPEALTRLADQTARDVSDLEKRIETLERKNGERKPFSVVHHSPLAAE